MITTLSANHAKAPAQTLSSPVPLFQPELHESGSSKAIVQGFIQVVFAVNKAAAGTSQCKEGRITSGKPISCANSFPSRNELAVFAGATGTPIAIIHWRNFSLSSALSMAFMSTPISFYINFSQYPELVCFFAEIESCLSAHSRQHSINLIFFQYLFNAFNCKWQQVNFICHHRVGHDGGRIAVDEDHFDAFFTQAPGSLCTAVIKFAGLSYYNG
jgi:hypothetical protein